ncbi:MAG: radical SAM protein [Anaerolineales bacterium]
MSSPRNVDIALTGRCNLTCKYCFYADEMVARSDLSTERWLAFFSELGRLGVVDVTLSGGEVFTRRDLFELIDGIIANRMRYSILSNGTLITEEVLEQFNIGKRRMRLNSIQVSIDGSTAEIHNKSRPRSFDRALRGLRLLVENDVPAIVRVTINKHNVDDLENIARLLFEDVGLPSFSTNEAFPMGAGKCDGESVILTRVMRQQAINTLTALNKQYDERISASAGPLAMARELADIQARMARGETGKPGRGTLASCGGVFQKISVNHDGAILPCTLLPSLNMGMIGTDDLQDVWLNHPAINAVRERCSIPTSTLDTCHDCPYVGFCTAGCPGMALNMTGELNARDPISCYRIQLGEEIYDALA